MRLWSFKKIVHFSENKCTSAENKDLFRNLLDQRKKAKVTVMWEKSLKSKEKIQNHVLVEAICAYRRAKIQWCNKGECSRAKKEQLEMSSNKISYTLKRCKKRNFD